MCVTSAFCVSDIFVVEDDDKPSKIDSKLIRTDRFLGLVNVLVSMHFLLSRETLNLVAIIMRESKIVNQAENILQTAYYVKYYVLYFVCLVLSSTRCINHGL